LRLQILTGKREGETIELGSGEHLVGTGSKAAVQLREDGVAFKHARIAVDGEAVSVRDLKSKHGTLLNGEPVGTDPVPVGDGDTLTVGAAELRFALAPVDAEEAPAPEDAAPVVEEAPAPEDAAPVVEEDAAPADAPAPEAGLPGATAPAEPEEDLGDDPDVLRDAIRDLRRRLREKTQEAEALHAAVEAGAAGGGAADATGYSATAADDLEGRILELRQIADEQTARALEKDEELQALRGELDRLKERTSESRDGAARERDAMGQEVIHAHEKLEEAKARVAEAEAEVARFEEVNAELLLENEELKERLEALDYKLEHDAAERGALVRERVTKLREETARMEQSNVEMRTLVEAYEEKIDELDERVEELEGENEALEQLVADLRADLTKAKHERETMVKTLRQKLKRAEQRLGEAQSQRTRAQAAAERSGDPELQDQAQKTAP